MGWPDQRRARSAEVHGLALHRRYYCAVYLGLILSVHGRRDVVLVQQGHHHAAVFF